MAKESTKEHLNKIRDDIYRLQEEEGDLKDYASIVLLNSMILQDVIYVIKILAGGVINP